MSNPLAHDRVHADALALQAIAERAGYALGCVYSSADEFEQAVIRTRRIGAFGARSWHWGHALGIIGVAAVLAIVLCMI